MNRIVVIEDDPAILRGLADNLRSASYDVLTASDGEAGYRLVQERQPDLVILDLTLPGMNGYEVCRQVRSHGLATPILMLTAQNLESDRVQGFDAGADDYVTKPFSLRELLGRVRAILRRSEGRTDLANQKELDEARRVQERLMPAEIPQILGLRIAATWRPARIVGGDYFDVLRLDDETVAVCIADVCGKGMPAAMMMSNLQAAVKTCASNRMSPGDLCARVNQLMCENIGARGFITFFYAVISQASKRLIYCNAGHNPPILVRKGPSPSGRGWRGSQLAGAPGEGSTRQLDCGGGILGVFPDWGYEEQELRLDTGECLLLYTDGITESQNTRGEEFSADRLLRLVQQSHGTDASGLVEAVIGAATQFSNGNFEDDLTVVAVSVD
jgi:serine phosphatase RsbU (regulator of sigma subunit)